MKYWNGHIVMEDVEWKDLDGIWDKMLEMFFQDSKQFRDNPDMIKVIIKENMIDISHNRKPEGYNREGKMRIVVPISDKHEFYVYRGVYSDDVRVLTEKISKFLTKNKIKHTVEWNDMMLFKIKKRRR
ncbi:MAG: hypothetical protein GXO25_04940 [Euryarchaeota archaeon]|nr:hypothetical protein [Euryarchaeota archaeon]